MQNHLKSHHKIVLDYICIMHQDQNNFEWLSSETKLIAQYFIQLPISKYSPENWQITFLTNLIKYKNKCGESVERENPTSYYVKTQQVNAKIIDPCNS